MAGHSQFKNIMHRKGAQDAKRAKRFTRLLREVTVAAKTGGGEFATNARLRTAVASARQANVPKDTIERAINKASDPSEQYEMVEYDAFGPGTSALIIHVLTNNRNRSACEVRTALNRYGGRLGDTKFLFQPCAMVVYPAFDSPDEPLLYALDHQGTDMEEAEGLHAFFCPRDHFFAFKEAMEAVYGPPLHAQLMWAPMDISSLDPEAQETMDKLMNALEECDDVQNVYCNTLSPLQSYIYANPPQDD